MIGVLLPADPTTQDHPESPGSDDPDPSRLNTDARTPGDTLVVELVLNTQEPEPPITGWLDQQLRHAVALCGVTHARLTLAIVEDHEMAELHEQYTGVPGTTDVLTFDLKDDPGQAASAPGSSKHPSPPALEADIVLCIDEAQRQADQRQHPLRHELLLYAVHGLLHLLGEDDHDEQSYQRMHQREDELLTKLGIGPTFNPKP